MERIIQQARKFRYHSFQYVIPSVPIKVFEKEDYVIVAEQDDKRIKFFWAVNSVEKLKQAIEVSVRDLLPTEIVLEFIPPEFLTNLELDGFRIISECVDFWLEDLQDKSWDNSLAVEIRPIKDREAGLAAAITRSCAGISREFKGEPEEEVFKWMKQEDHEIFVAIKDEHMVGVCMMATYDGRQGKVAWVRELAVHPEYQYLGIGRSLVKFGLIWGQKRGCTRSFLATDTENFHAIRLYEKLGYQCQKGRGQINMAKRFC